MVGVLRGPFPWSSRNVSAPVCTLHLGVPFTRSIARTDSWLPGVPIVKTVPLATLTLEYPWPSPAVGVDQAGGGPPSGHSLSRPVSCDWLSRLGPKKQGQAPPPPPPPPPPPDLPGGLFMPANGVVATGRASSALGSRSLLPDFDLRAVCFGLRVVVVFAVDLGLGDFGVVLGVSVWAMIRWVTPPSICTVTDMPGLIAVISTCFPSRSRSISVARESSVGSS